MKSLLFVLLALFSTSVLAGEASFTWSYSNDGTGDNAGYFEGVGPIPDHWKLDKFRISCETTVGATVTNYTRTIDDGAARDVTYVDLPEGQTDCHLQAWSDDTNNWSVASITVSKFVLPFNIRPAPPTICDFTPKQPDGANLKNKFTATIAGVTFKGKCTVIDRPTRRNKLDCKGKEAKVN